MTDPDPQDEAGEAWPGPAGSPQEAEAAPAGGPEVEEPPVGGPEVVVYWRPGCPFCTTLLRRLAKGGLAPREVNIWDDPDAAAQVRAVAGGNETVPTVHVAGRFLVNPSARAVLALAAEAGIPVEAPPSSGRLWRR
ncbi:MAG TPA: glutaredoxin domain-containing protein [Acidimicrobiales bacterium]|nr:glutaredoxin domain-containing protein [Acidimicrobiales bacterium]